MSGVEMRAVVGWKIVGGNNGIYLTKYKQITV
jgi:hypothetical protein